jgi:hypothetical protein
MLESAPISTSPITRAVAAIQADASTRGEVPS